MLHTGEKTGVIPGLKVDAAEDFQQGIKVCFAGAFSPAMGTYFILGKDAGCFTVNP